MHYIFNKNVLYLEDVCTTFIIASVSVLSTHFLEVYSFTMV